MKKTIYLVAAVRIDGQVRIGDRGSGHDAILADLPGYPENRHDSSVLCGFTTNDGRFLSRKEAFRYAAKHDLLIYHFGPGEHELTTEDLKD